MPKIPGINHTDAVRALIRQGKHIIMSDGVRTLTIPRGHPINAYTMGEIASPTG